VVSLMGKDKHNAVQLEAKAKSHFPCIQIMCRWLLILLIF